MTRGASRPRSSAASASPPTCRPSRTPTSWSRRSSSRSRSRRTSSAGSTTSSARRDPGHQHLVAAGHRDRHRQHPPRPGRGRALLQPRAGAEPRRDRPHRRDRAGRAGRRRGPAWAALGKNPVVCGDKAGFIANTLLFGYLNHAVVDVRGQVRHPRGHRRGHALRLRLPDGPAGAARPDRPRHGVRDPRDDVQAGPRPPARAGADPQADGHRRAAGPQVRPRLLHLRAGRQPGRRRRRPDPVRPTTCPSSAHDIRTVGVVGTGTMAAGIVEVFAKSGYDVLYVGRSADKVEGVRATIEKSLRQGDPARQAPRRRARPRCWAGSPARRRSTTWPRVDLVVEAIAEDLADQDHALREPRRDLQARRDPGDHHLLAAGHLAGQGDLAAAGRHRHALLQPGADHEAGRGRLHGRHRRRRRRDRAGPVRQGRQGRGLVRRPGRASSSTRCCSPTSTTR